MIEIRDIERMCKKCKNYILQNFPPLILSLNITPMCVIEREFQPILNYEHDGYAWVAYSAWPRPLHCGVKNTLSKSVNRAKLETILAMT